MNLPTDEWKGNNYITFEIKPPKAHLKVRARVEHAALCSMYDFVTEKRRRQCITLSENSNVKDVIALNYRRLLGDPEKFLSSYRYVSTSDDGIMTYLATSADGEKQMSLPTGLFFQIPEVEENICETKTFTYDLKKLEELVEDAPGGYITISYKQKENNGQGKLKPWRIKIANYLLKAGIEAGRKNVREEFVELTDEQFAEVIEFAHQEWRKFINFQDWKALSSFEEK